MSNTEIALLVFVAAASILYLMHAGLQTAVGILSLIAGVAGVCYVVLFLLEH